MNYFDIAWSSQKDGPGTRVVLFLQGCSLHCVWCHSPHSQPKYAPILFYPEYCKKCGKCTDTCKNHTVKRNRHSFSRDGCTKCGRCVLSCPNKALDLKFYQNPPSAVFNKLRPELMLLEGLGGLTVSGGEPLLQFEELKELLVLCKNSGIHTAVETCGAVGVKAFEEIYDYVDCWLFDLKQTDKNLCKIMTGADIDIIINNLSLLAERAPDRVIIRIPLIAGFTDDISNIKRIADIMKSKGLKRIELLPYNPFTEYYYKAAGIAFNRKLFTVPSKSRLEFVQDLLVKNDINAVIVK